LIENGDFSKGTTYWGEIVLVGTATVNADSGVACIDASGETAMNISWPTLLSRFLSLVDGKSYRFSFKASCAGACDENVGVSGSVATPAYVIHSLQPTPLSSSLQTFEGTFLVDGSFPQVGVTLVVTTQVEPVQVCFDDVILAQLD
jgi:hypothetical protein